MYTWLKNKLRIRAATYNVRTAIPTPLSARATLNMGFTAMQKQTFDEKYKAACNADDTHIVKLKDELLQILMQANLSTERHVHCKSMAVHNKNRGGSKMQTVKIYQKASKILTVGVSLTKCGPDSAIAFVDNPATQIIAKTHVDWSKTSPHVANYNLESIEGGSCGCGHWNQFLAALYDEVECPEMFGDRLCENGCTHLDKERLCKDQPVLRELLKHGIRWTMINKDVEIMYPELPSLFQKALNVEHHIGEGPYNV